MSIIEKLGIKTPDEIKIVLDVYAVYDLAGLKRPNISTLNFDEAWKLKKILDDKNEMLEALIIHASIEVSKGGIFPVLAVMVEATRELIEKTTGKKWEEIKQIVDKENTCLK